MASFIADVSSAYKKQPVIDFGMHEIAMMLYNNNNTAVGRLLCIIQVTI